MSCTRQNCARNESKITVDTEVAALQAAGIDLLNYLLEVARGGLPSQVTRLINVTTFQNAAVKDLADKIAALVNENEYLKKLAGAVIPTRFQVTDDTLEVAFGPELAYTLRIPVTTVAAREQVAAQLLHAAQRLQPAHDQMRSAPPEQQTFQFMSCSQE